MKKLINVYVSVPAVAGFTFELDKAEWEALTPKERADRLTELVKKAPHTDEDTGSYRGIAIPHPDYLTVDEDTDFDEYDVDDDYEVNYGV